MFDASFVRSIHELTQAALLPTVQEIQPLRKVLITDRSGSVLHDKPPPLRAVKIAGLDDLIECIKNDDSDGNPEVYYNANGITLLYSGADRRESATLALETTQRWRKLATLAGGYSANQKDALRMLRFDLADCGSGVAGAITALRSIDFTRRTLGGSTIDHGRETFGRSVEAKVEMGSGLSLPESFQVEFPIWVNPGVQKIQARLTVGIEIDLDTEKPTFYFRVSPDSLVNAINLGLDTIGEEIRGRLAKDYPEMLIVQGTP